MKKIIMLMIFGILSMESMALDLWVKGGIMEGVGAKKIKKPGYTAGVEVSQGILGFLDLGVGTAYNGNLKFDDGTDKSREVGFDLVPVYGFVKYNFIPIAIKPYIIGRIGTNIIANDRTHYYKNEKKAGVGGYGAIGLGVELISSLEVEALYSVSQIKDNPTGNDNIQMVSITLGYNFF